MFVRGVQIFSEATNYLKSKFKLSLNLGSFACINYGQFFEMAQIMSQSNLDFLEFFIIQTVTLQLNVVIQTPDYPKLSLSWHD